MIDFTDKAYDDSKLFREQLTKVLTELENRINNGGVIPKGIIVYFVQSDLVTIPDGYAKADGNNKTFDVSNQQLIPIQKL